MNKKLKVEMNQVSRQNKYGFSFWYMSIYNFLAK